MFVFRPGTFDDAPHTFISSVQGAARPGRARRACRRAVVNGYPERLGDRPARGPRDDSGHRQQRDARRDRRRRAGAVQRRLILIGAVSMTKFRRVYEAAILKTLGASSRLIATMLLLEYGVLGAIAGTVGALGAIALSWAVARFALELRWEADAAPHHRPASSPPPSSSPRSACSPASTCSATSRWRRSAPSRGRSLWPC